MLLWPEASASLLTLRCVFPPWQPVVGLLSVSALSLSLFIITVNLAGLLLPW